MTTAQHEPAHADHSALYGDDDAAARFETGPLAGDRLLTVRQAAALTGRTEKGIRWHVHNGTAPRSGLIGGRRMFLESDVAAWIEAQLDEQNGQHAA